MRFSACMFLCLTRLPPSQSYIRNLDQLIELGETISDEALAEAKGQLRPDHLMSHFFSSVSAFTKGATLKI